MKKIIISSSLVLAAVVMAGGIVLAQTNSSARPTPSPRPTPNVSCITTAITTRDNAIIAARDAQHTAIDAALTTRISELSAAWQQTVAKTRQVDLKLAWQDYANAAKNANRTYSTARLAAWKQFATNDRACGPASADNSMGSSVDAQ